MKTNKKSLKKPSALSNSKSPSTPEKSRITKIKDSFTALTAIVSFVAAVLGLLVLYANNKGAFSELKNDFYVWLYEKDSWTGLFNNFPEGYVDMASMNLSDTGLQLVMIINGGRIDGVISDKKLCKIGFPNGYKLLKWDIGIFGKTAEIQAFDFEQGFLREYAKLAVKRDGVVLEVKAKKGSEWLLPQPIRIAQHPTTDTDTAMKGLLKFCDEERAELMNLIIKNRDKPPPWAEGKN